MTNNANINTLSKRYWKNLAFLFLMRNHSLLMFFFKKLFIKIHQIQAFSGAGKCGV
jgi:hypothetical protein